MVRNMLAKSGGAYNGVPWRSQEVTRVEALSDAVFAFAVTLLVVALEVPETFAELWIKMQGFVAFALSFAMLFHVWYSQHIFFRRYGLQDGWTVTLNGVLLFLVLFYMYPLKFLSSFLVSQLTGGGGMAHLAGGRVESMVETDAQGKTLMLVYALGFGAVFGIFALLYWRAWRLRGDLELSDLEVFDARNSIEHNLLMVAVAVVSIGALYAFDSPGLAGMTYMLIGPILTAYGAFRGRQRRRRYEEPAR